jgi:hypothetical protein
MKWFEVVTGCDGYASPERFKTEKEASDYIEKLEQEDGDDLYVFGGPYLVDTESNEFWSQVNENE